GRLLHHGITRRRPTAEQAAYIRARDRTCRAPGCRQPAHHADIDHTRDWAHGGPTTISNMAVLCRRHHRMKHQGGWLLHHTASGILFWTSPLGKVYVTTPPNLAHGPSG